MEAYENCQKAQFNNQLSCDCCCSHKIRFYVSDSENVKNKCFSFGISRMHLNISQVLREMSCQRADFTLVATWQLLIRLDRSVPNNSVALTWFFLICLWTCESCFCFRYSMYNWPFWFLIIIQQPLVKHVVCIVPSWLWNPKSTFTISEVYDSCWSINILWLCIFYKLKHFPCQYFYLSG